MSRNPEETRARLLAAARAEFAEHGLAGSRVDRIATTAGCNKERIYAYYGSKEKLYDTVLEKALTQIRAATPLHLHEGEDMGDFVRRVYEFHRADPSLMRIFMWEALEMDGRDSLVADAERRAFYRDRVREMAEQLGVTDLGRMRMMFIVLVALGAWATALPNLVHLIGDGELDDEAGRDALREFLVGIAVAGRGMVEGEKEAEG